MNDTTEPAQHDTYDPTEVHWADLQAAFASLGIHLGPNTERVEIHPNHIAVTRTRTGIGGAAIGPISGYVARQTTDICIRYPRGTT